jgi:serine/threonine protein kinase
MKAIGNYKVFEQIGSGSSSSVHIAIHSQTNQKCCVKMISKLNIFTKKDREHIISEIKILKSIHHPNK